MVRPSRFLMVNFTLNYRVFKTEDTEEKWSINPNKGNALGIVQILDFLSGGILLMTNAFFDPVIFFRISLV